MEIMVKGCEEEVPSQSHVFDEELVATGDDVSSFVYNTLCGLPSATVRPLNLPHLFSFIILMARNAALFYSWRVRQHFVPQRRPGHVVVETLGIMHISQPSRGRQALAGWRICLRQRPAVDGMVI